MAMVKICPLCGLKNSVTEIICANCLADISGVLPTPDEPEQPVLQKLVLECVS